MDEIRGTEVDGVPTVWTDLPGPLQASLTFRQGSADETLRTAGRSHLLEHLALYRLAGPDLHHNGMVDAVTTGFVTSGPVERTVDFLQRVCRGVSDPPAERLEDEKRVLAAEASARSRSAWRALCTARYGAAGHGLSGLPELGLHDAGIEDLQALAAERFTRGNAVLALSGPPPAGLRLELPDGPRRPVPEPRPFVTDHPSWLGADVNGIAVSAVLPFSTALTVLLGVADHLLHASLRDRWAVSYAPTCTAQRWTEGLAHVLLSADAPAEHRDRASREFAVVVESLGRPQPELVERVRAGRLEELVEPGAADDRRRAALAEAATAQLHGWSPQPVDELSRRLEQVTADEVAALGRELLRSALFTVHPAARLYPAFGRPAERSAADPVDGRVLTHRDAPLDRRRLLVARDGVTLAPDDRPGLGVTVRFDALAAAVRHDDGGWLLVGEDGVMIEVEPPEWRSSKGIDDFLTARVAPEALIRRPARAEGTGRAPEVPRAMRWAVGVGRLLSPRGPRSG